MSLVFLEVAEIAHVAAQLGQFQQPPKTRMISILNFTQPHVITYTYSFKKKLAETGKTESEGFEST